MTEGVIIALVAAGGTIGGAAITALGAFLLYRRKYKDKRADQRADRSDNVTKALRYLMLYVIQERGKELLAQGYSTLEERRSLHHWHDLYHNGLRGNGDADRLMEAVDELPYDLDQYAAHEGGH